MPFSIHDASKNFRKLIGASADMLKVTVTTGGVTSDEIDAMPQRPSRSSDGLGEGEVPASTMTFLIWVCDLPTRPQKWDLVTEVDTGSRWRVQSVDLTCGRGRWDVACVQEVPAGEQSV